MTIELDDKSYIIGMWFSSCPKTENNWLACFITDPENPKRYKGWSRFRYAKEGSGVFNSDDEKSWTTVYAEEGRTEQEIIGFMRLAQHQIEEGYPEKDEIIVQGGLKKLMKLSKNKPWMHIRTEKISK